MWLPLCTTRYVLHFDITIYVIFINVCGSKQKSFPDNENHNLDTRQRNNLYLPQANLTIYQKRAYYSGIKIFNNLPLQINPQKILKFLWKIFTLLLILHNWRVP